MAELKNILLRPSTGKIGNLEGEIDGKEKLEGEHKRDGGVNQQYIKVFLKSKVASKGYKMSFFFATICA